jgi:hypothetical protein
VWVRFGSVHLVWYEETLDGWTVPLTTEPTLYEYELVGRRLRLRDSRLYHTALRPLRGCSETVVQGCSVIALEFTCHELMQFVCLQTLCGVHFVCLFVFISSTIRFSRYGLWASSLATHNHSAIPEATLKSSN